MSRYELLWYCHCYISVLMNYVPVNYYMCNFGSFSKLHSIEKQPVYKRKKKKSLSSDIRIERSCDVLQNMCTLKSILIHSY